MPYYRVDQKGVDAPRVVRADTAAAALRFVSKDAFTVSKPLNSDELMDLVNDGIKTERAGEDSAEADKTKDEEDGAAAKEPIPPVDQPDTSKAKSGAKEA